MSKKATDKKNFFTLCTRFIGMSVALLFQPILAWSQPDISPNEFSDVLEEGKHYEFRVGQNNFGGHASIVRKGQVFYVELPMFVFGASLFGLTNYQEVLATNKYDLDHIDPKLFVANAKNFKDNPYLKNKVLNSLSQIEARFSHANFKLKIKPVFVQDETTYYKLPGPEYKVEGLPFPYGYYAQTAQVTDVQNNRRINGKKMALFIQPFFVSANMSPVGFEIYSPFHPSLIAHEIGHILGVASEGYTLKDYPLNALMTAETQLQVLSEKRKGFIQSQLQNVDLFSIIVGIIQGMADSKVVSETTFRRLQNKSIDAIYNHQVTLPDGRGWYQMSGKERRAYIESIDVNALYNDAFTFTTGPKSSLPANF